MKTFGPRNPEVVRQENIAHLKTAWNLQVPEDASPEQISTALALLSSHYCYKLNANPIGTARYLGWNVNDPNETPPDQK